MDDKKRGCSLHNPFPREPASLGLVKGKLFFSNKFKDEHSWAAGDEFEVHWKPEDGGSVRIHHRDEPNRSMWSSLPGKGFVSAGLGSESVEESRGSFAIHEKTDVICSHQTLEEVFLIFPEQFNASSISKNGSFLFEHVAFENQDGDGVKCVPKGAIVVITGCLYSDPSFALIQLKEFLALNGEGQGPLYSCDTNLENPGCFSLCKHKALAGVKYWLAFFQKRDHHLGFVIKLGQPVMLPTRLRNKNNAKYCRKSEERELKQEQGNAYMLSKEAMVLPWGKRFISALSGLRSQASSRKTKEKVDSTRQGTSNLTSIAAEEAIGLPSFNRLQFTYLSEKNERFYGFGEQFSYFDMKGRRVPILVQEQGVGRGDQPVTAAANLFAFRAGGNRFTTYAPVPFYLTSAMRSLFLEVHEYSVFDFQRQDQVQVQVNAAMMHGRILYGKNVIELIKHYTEAIGRMKALPDWILEGAVVGMQGGTEVVKRIWKQLQQHDVPIAAFWLQDWVGKRKTIIGSQLWWNWEVDRDQYPGWEDLVRELQSENICTMTYLNPMLTLTDEKKNRQENLYAEASSQGFFVKDEKGNPYMIQNTSFDAGLLDLTNPAACTWFKSLIRKMVQTGVRGWMADFGEALPFDSSLFAGVPSVVHNKFPELWAEVNREFVEEWEKEQQGLRRVNSLQVDSLKEQLVFFMRAGYTSSPKWCTLFWEGDQMVSWQRHDGLKSAVVGLLTSGISGFSFNHSDIGGYTTVDSPVIKYKRSEELFQRWAELNAFSTIFRTHEGNEPSANVQFYTNERTFLHFARFAKVYRAWSFYRKQLVKESSTTGLPVIRHMVLHYPEDKYVQKIIYQQFLVGSEILVVPVLDKGRKRVKAYFPPGDVWQHVWTGTLFSDFNGGGVNRWIYAPLGYPAIFIKHLSSIGLQFVQNLVEAKIIKPQRVHSMNGHSQNVSTEL